MDSFSFIKALKKIKQWPKEDLRLFGYQDAFDLAFNLNSYTLNIINSFDDQKLQVCNAFLNVYSDAIPSIYIKEIIERLYNNDTSLYYVLPLFLNNELKNREDYLDIIRNLLDAKGNSQVKYGSLVAGNKEVLERDDASKIISIVLNSKFDYQVKNASRVACDVDVLQNEDAINYVYVTSKAKGRHQAECASEYATNPEILKRDDGICFTTLISNSNDIYEIYYLDTILNDDRLWKKEDPLYLVNLGYSIFVDLRDTPKYKEWINYGSIDILVNDLMLVDYDKLKLAGISRIKKDN